MTARRGRRIAIGALLALLAACGRDRPQGAGADGGAPAGPPPVALDSGGTALLELWTIPPATGGDPSRRLRRVVEHLHADVAIAPGFIEGGLLATGDGRTLLALLRWRDTAAALRARPVIAGWLGVRGDDPAARRAAGSTTPVVRVPLRVGAAPVLVADSGVWVLERYALTPGHSFPALLRVVQQGVRAQLAADTAVRGAVVLVHADSQAVVSVVQARAVNGLELPPAEGAPLPPWAPFATRERRLGLVVTTMRQRGGPALPARAADSVRR